VIRAPAGGLPLVLAAALLWSLLGVFSRGLLEAGVGPLEIAFWRATIAGGLFALHRLLLARANAPLPAEPTPPRVRLALVAFALIGVTLFYSALSLAIATGGISLAFILLYTAPVFVLVLGWPLLGERPSLRQWGLVALASLGVALVARASAGGLAVSTTALGWGLTAGLSYASYYLLGKWLLRTLPPSTLFAWMLPIGALALWPLVSFTPGKSAAMWGALLVLGLLCTYLAYWLYSLGLQRMSANRAVLVATVEPVAAALWAALLFGERLGAWGWLGALLVVGSAALAAVAPARIPTRGTPLACATPVDRKPWRCYPSLVCKRAASNCSHPPTPMPRALLTTTRARRP
jgi:drug/metabolite transporter, DME family